MQWFSNFILAAELLGQMKYFTKPQYKRVKSSEVRVSGLSLFLSVTPTHPHSTPSVPRSLELSGPHTDLLLVPFSPVSSPPAQPPLGCQTNINTGLIQTFLSTCHSLVHQVQILPAGSKTEMNHTFNLLFTLLWLQHNHLYTPHCLHSWVFLNLGC